MKKTLTALIVAVSLAAVFILVEGAGQKARAAGTDGVPPEGVTPAGVAAPEATAPVVGPAAPPAAQREQASKQIAEKNLKDGEEETDSVSLSYDRLPTFYQERDASGILGPPAVRVNFGDNTQKEVAIRATVRGITSVCPLIYQDVAYVLDKEGRRGQRIPIFGYQGCPFTIDGPLQVTKDFEMREEITIEIEKASGTILWVSSKSARPLASAGMSIATGCEMFINTTWVFKSKGTEFVAGGEKFVTEKADATVKFTKSGVVMDGISNVAGQKARAAGTDGVPPEGVTPAGVTPEAAAPAAQTEGVLLATPRARVSYCIGLDFGNTLKMQSIDVEPDIVAKGMKDALTGTKPLLTEQEFREVMTVFEREYATQREQALRQLAEKNLKDGAEFLAANKTKEGVVTLPDGLQYIVLKAGTGASPKATDTVTTHYRGTLIDGTEFDSTYDDNQPATFPLNGVIPGWTEALQMMNVGAKWKLFIPAKLAYGAEGRGGVIGPNAVLVFEIELVSIQPAR